MKEGQTNTIKRFSISISVAATVVVLDQFTKWMIVEWVPLFEKIPINDFINIVAVWERVFRLGMIVSLGAIAYFVSLWLSGIRISQFFKGP